jgi:hypothetical protein
MLAALPYGVARHPAADERRYNAERYEAQQDAERHTRYHGQDLY